MQVNFFSEINFTNQQLVGINTLFCICMLIAYARNILNEYFYNVENYTYKTIQVHLKYLYLHILIVKLNNGCHLLYYVEHRREFLIQAY